jgi:hypothetical protein
MYCAFSVFFFLLDQATSGTGWFVFPVLGWGIGVAAHAIKYLFPVEPSPRRLAKKKERRLHGQASDSAIEEGADFLLTATEHRARVAVPGDASQRRVRVERGSDRAELDAEAIAEADAESIAEADAEARGKRSRKKRSR